MDVKKRLRDLMDERGWSVSQLAREGGLPRSTVQSLFARDTDPTIATIEAICRGLHISLAQFFEEESDIGLTDEQRGLIFRWSCLGEREQQLVQDMLDVLAQH